MIHAKTCCCGGNEPCTCGGVPVALDCGAPATPYKLAYTLSSCSRLVGQIMGDIAGPPVEDEPLADVSVTFGTSGTLKTACGHLDLCRSSPHTLDNPYTGGGLAAVGGVYAKNTVDGSTVAEFDARGDFPAPFITIDNIASGYSVHHVYVFLTYHWIDALPSAPTPELRFFVQGFVFISLTAPEETPGEVTYATGDFDSTVDELGFNGHGTYGPTSGNGTIFCDSETTHDVTMTAGNSCEIGTPTNVVTSLQFQIDDEQYNPRCATCKSCFTLNGSILVDVEEAINTEPVPQFEDLPEVVLRAECAAGACRWVSVAEVTAGDVTVHSVTLTNLGYVWQMNINFTGPGGERTYTMYGKGTATRCCPDSITEWYGTDGEYGWIEESGETHEVYVGVGTFVFAGAKCHEVIPSDPPDETCGCCGQCIQLGSNESFTAKCDGLLVLIVNDNNHSDNVGSWSVTVTRVSDSTIVWAGNLDTGVAEHPTVMLDEGETYHVTASGTSTGMPGAGDPDGEDGIYPFDELANWPCVNMLAWSLTARVEEPLP